MSSTGNQLNLAMAHRPRAAYLTRGFAFSISYREIANQLSSHLGLARDLMRTGSQTKSEPQAEVDACGRPNLSKYENKLSCKKKQTRKRNKIEKGSRLLD